MSPLLLELLKTTANTTAAAADGYSRRPVKGKRKRQKASEGCTPCAAIARKERARSLVRGA